MQTLFDIFMKPDSNIRIRYLRRKYFRIRRQNAYLFLQNLQAAVMPELRDRPLWVNSVVGTSHWWDNLVIKFYKDSEFNEDFEVSRQVNFVFINMCFLYIKTFFIYFI